MNPTTSISQGHGLVLSATMNDQETFETIWQETSPMLLQNGLFEWSWLYQGGTSDTKGDQNIAYGLLLATARGWPDRPRSQQTGLA